MMIVSVLLFVSACGNGSGSLFKDGIEDYIGSTYQLFDTVTSTANSDDYAQVYIAENQDISTVASDIQNHEKPSEMSEERDGKQIFIYDKQFVTLTESQDDASDTMIEVAGEEFVQKNYRPSFFEGYLVASLLGNMFGNNWSSNRNQACSLNPSRCYGGYNSADSFAGKNAIPTIRGGSVRGGGIGSGK